MNLNDKRLGAYNRILKSGPGEPDPAARKTADDPQKPPVSDRKDGDRQKPPAPPADAPRPAAMGQRPDVAGQRPPASGQRPPSFELPGLVKVPSSGTGGKESPFRRVAKFLLLIGVDEAAKVMSKLTPEQTEKVVLELASIRRVDKDEAAIVLAEFESLIKQAHEPSGGVETARTILETAFGRERADEMLRKAVPDLGGKPFDYLEDIDPAKLYHIVADELPQVKAMVLSQLKPKLAAEVIKLMDSEDKHATIMRLAKLERINPEVLRRVDEAIREKVKNVNTSSADSIDGRSALAEILKRMDGSTEKSILEGLSGSDPDLGRDIRERLFTIDDILQADDRFMQEKLRAMSEHDLAVLIAGKGEGFRRKILANVSRTRGDVILEEEQIISPVMRGESEKITGAFFAVMRRAWESGEFFLAGRDEKEVWIK